MRFWVFLYLEYGFVFCFFERLGGFGGGGYVEGAGRRRSSGT